MQVNLLRDTPSRKHNNNQVKTPTQYNDLELCNVDYVSSNVKSCQFGAMLHISEDDDAMIKIIIKGRSPTMRHVSRTHRVALDRLFDRINLDPKVQIKNVDTKKQIEDILTKGSFTRDEWNNLLRLVNIICSSASCPETVAKRMQQGTGEEKIKADVEPGLAHCGKLFHSAEFECFKSSGEFSEHPVSKVRISQHKVQETCRWRFKSKWRGVEFSSVVNRCKNEQQCEETRCCRNEPGSESSRMCKDCCRKFRNQRRGRLEVVAQLPHISC